MFFVILYFVGQFLYAQNMNNALRKSMDSLKLEVKQAKHDSSKCNALNYLVELESDEAVWSKYNDEIKRIAESNLKTVDSN